MSPSPKPAERTLHLAESNSTVLVFADADAASKAAADRIVRIIAQAVAARGKAILGLATGATPEKVYDDLAARVRDGGLSFRDVTTYNLDEYYPIQPLDALSYRTYMHRHLFSRVDLAPNRAHILDGTVPETFASEHAAQFDRWIDDDGGLDLQLLGIGRNGHIGFNEPLDLTVEAFAALPTRLVDLHPITKVDAVREFGSVDAVIPRALTMGVRQILGARTILMLATGPKKAAIVAEALKGPITAAVPASLLRTVADKVVWLLDEPAAAELG
ncbi:glucosamine-6-phosphate deaminase [Planctomyces sp. SH-PL62]|uniref:glucosamine-6-phosphate deaminase n=1 Tax=Planctomyces sp. SH-PL62 TaxID=1636152 RepID=UPI00078D259A|nr:glucosamine-6-phosphate deaminase [Planctomyces sp. SH-PL62]AMV37944.1 Glucosamine-6-phosphate deaminase 1 [Planctomyces sp. SH-PL62]